MHDKGNIIRTGTFFQGLKFIRLGLLQWLFSLNRQKREKTLALCYCRSHFNHSHFTSPSGNLHFKVCFNAEPKYSSPSELFLSIFSLIERAIPLTRILPKYFFQSNPGNTLFPPRLNPLFGLLHQKEQLDQRSHVLPTEGDENISPGHHSTAWKLKINELNIQIPGKELPAFLKYTSFFPHSDWGSRNRNQVGPSPLKTPRAGRNKRLTVTYRNG